MEVVQGGRRPLLTLRFGAGLSIELNRVPFKMKSHRARTCCCILDGPDRGRWLRSLGSRYPFGKTSPGLERRGMG